MTPTLTAEPEFSRYRFTAQTSFSTDTTSLLLTADPSRTEPAERRLLDYQSNVYDSRLPNNTSYSSAIRSQLHWFGVRVSVLDGEQDGGIYIDRITFLAPSSFPVDQFAAFAMTLLELSKADGCIRSSLHAQSAEAYQRTLSQFIRTQLNSRVSSQAIRHLAAQIHTLSVVQLLEADLVAGFSTLLAELLATTCGVPKPQLLDYLESPVVQFAFRNDLLRTPEDLQALLKSTSNHRNSVVSKRL